MPTAANLAIKEIDKTPGENQPRGFFATTVVLTQRQRDLPARTKPTGGICQRLTALRALFKC